jgi:RNA-binding protein YhbY
MATYRITFADGEQNIVSTDSVKQAIASAVRNDPYDREIVKVEKWGYTQDERTEIARELNRQQGATY